MESKEQLLSFTATAYSAPVAFKNRGVGFIVRTKAVQLRRWHPLDGRICFGHFVVDDQEFVLFSCYAPTLNASQETAKWFYEQLSRALTQAWSKYPRFPLLLGGDFNTTIDELRTSAPPSCERVA